MKRTQKLSLIFVVAVAILSVGCWIGYEHFSRSYIQEYMLYNGVKVRRHLSSSTKNLDLYVEVSHRVNFLSEGNDKVMYDKICEANGDVSYNQNVHLPLDVPTIMTSYPHISKINVYSDKDFDANHPAGTSLNDVMTICYRSAIPYIESGYTADSLLLEEIVKPLNELGTDDLRMELSNVFLRFTQDPDELSTHVLTFECTNAEGNTYNAYYEYDFSLPEGKVETEVETKIIYKQPR